MASSFDEQPPPLKDKLNNVKSLLRSANDRLQEEVSKYEIFTTEASASSSSNTRLNGDQSSRLDIIRTITDISTLESVLSCPIFDHIVNVTDSLDQLSYHLNLHPSITEFDIDTNSGELILTPPIEFTALGDFMPNQVSNQYTDSQLDINLNLAKNISALTDEPLNQAGSQFYNADINAGYARAYPQRNGRNLSQQTPSHNVQSFHVPSSGIGSPMIFDGTEKLIVNGDGGGGPFSGKSVAEPLYLQPTYNESKDAAASRQYKSNGHFSPTTTSPRDGFQSIQSVNQIGNQNNEQRRASYSNELSKTPHGLNKSKNDITSKQHFKHQHHQNSTQQLQQEQQKQHKITELGDQTHKSLKEAYSHNPTANGRSQINNQTTGVLYNRSSRSPSSAGSTVRLADECDSGASSYQSQQARGSLPSYQSKGLDGNAVDSDTVEQELIKNLSPDLERIKVTLERDEMGLGITIAGYCIEDEEISGIFIRSVTPGSPADRCGKIKEFDEIFSVNGNELVGYSNEEALVLLRQSGKVVTLELMRHSDELKHNKLKAFLAQAQCPYKQPKRSDSLESAGKGAIEDSNLNIASPAKSSIPISRGRNSANKSPTKPPVNSKPKALVQVSTYQESSLRKAQEAIYKNDSLSSRANETATTKVSNNVTSPSHIPIAAQRGGTNKVIETKQGSRNTIDIRSPACQMAVATYVNKVDDLDLSDPSREQNNSASEKLERDSSDGFGFTSEHPEWDKDATIIVLRKEKPDQSLGFSVKDYANPKNPAQPIIMITSITAGGIADRDGQLAVGDLLIFVDDKDLRGQVLTEAIKALKKTEGHASLGVLKLKRS